MGFLPFTPQGFINYFWFVMGIPSGLPINPLVARPLPPLGESSAFSFFHHPCHDKIFLFWSSSRLSPLALVDKGLGLSIPTSMACIAWSQSSTASFGQNAIPTRHFSQKKLWLETQNRLFPLNTKPHPLNPLTACPSLLYWLGTSGRCSGLCVLVPPSLTFVFFHSHAIFAMSHSAMCLFYSCLSTM